MPANFDPFQRLSCVHVHTHDLYWICVCSSVYFALKISQSTKNAYVLMLKLKLPYHVTAASSSIKIG
jgi:hypothetical protein